MDLRAFQAVNAARGRRWHHGDLGQWSLLEWCGAMAGEAGEACNAAKKLRRLDLALPNKEAGIDKSEADALRHQLARECADTIIYALLVMSAMGVEADVVLEGVFDKKSIEYGFPERAMPGAHRALVIEENELHGYTRSIQGNMVAMSARTLYDELYQQVAPLGSAPKRVTVQVRVEG